MSCVVPRECHTRVGFEEQARAEVSGYVGDHHIPEQDFGRIEYCQANVSLVHVVYIPELVMVAVVEIAEYEDARPAVQDVDHLLETAPVAIIVPADLVSHAKILFQKPL